MVAETKLYTALSIKPEATQDEIKKAYRYVVPSNAVITPPLHHQQSPAQNPRLPQNKTK